MNVAEDSRLQIAPTGRARSCDLRKGRVSEHGRLYHVRTATDRRRPLFADFMLGREVVKSMRFLHQRGDVESLAFVIMPDHLHWLFELRGERRLDQVLRSLKRHTARAINGRLGASGVAVWQTGYFDRAVRREEDIKGIARYMVANPLRAGLCERIENYALWDAAWL